MPSDNKLGACLFENKTSRLSEAWVFQATVYAFYETLSSQIPRKLNPSNSTAIQYSDPSTMALYFPNELIHEVLLRLPGKIPVEVQVRI